jgi:signal transduction histidine kinase
MDIIAHEIERLNTLITDFLAYARPRPLQYDDVNIHKLISGTLDLLCNGLLEGSAVTVCTEFACEVLRIAVDPQGLRQVIWNLCLNAVEAMHYRGTLTVRTARQPQLNQPRRGHMPLLTATKSCSSTWWIQDQACPWRSKKRSSSPSIAQKTGAQV